MDSKKFIEALEKAGYKGKWIKIKETPERKKREKELYKWLEAKRRLQEKSKKSNMMFGGKNEYQTTKR